ncbi:MAG TPA: hypothetical protein VN455_09875 [Methanotrichaceae archaeon]|nr:hypothetical protein [Methanotrichaceae archaeon]
MRPGSAKSAYFEAGPGKVPIRSDLFGTRETEQFPGLASIEGPLSVLPVWRRA